MKRKGRAYGVTFLIHFVSLLLLLAVVGCTTVKPVKQEAPPETVPTEPQKREESVTIEKTKKKNHSKRYQVKGKYYYPLITTEGYEEKGIASWYGPSFHGRKTSCGEVFDMYKCSAAHKLLPMHTKVIVTNLENGKSLSLQVNDRGPFVAGRTVDVSYAAGKKLGIIEKGTARVVVKAVKLPCQTDDDMTGNFLVHVGSFDSKKDAEILIEDMKSIHYKSTRLKVIKWETDAGRTRWRVGVGPYKSITAANRAHARIVRDYPSAFVVAPES